MMDSGLCGLLNANRRESITYRRTDATNSPMFSLAPMLPISDVQIGLTLVTTMQTYGFRKQHDVFKLVGEMFK